MKRVIIVGSSGQDGRILFDRRATDCAVLGLDVGTVREHGLGDRAAHTPLDLGNHDQVLRLVERVAPHEVYYLAAHHHSSQEHPAEAEEFRQCFDVHVAGLVNVLEAVRLRAPDCRVFFAGSSQMFGQPARSPQDENTPFLPRNPYAITKVAAAHACAAYRERNGLHVSVGILYNHESPLRGPAFVTTRIARGVRRAMSDPSFKLKLGSLSTVVDWGYAPDYVDAMIRIVSAAVPDDYVIASGEPHTVREFAELAFACAGLDWRDHVEEDPSLLGHKPFAPGAPVVGNASKLRTRTGWRPTIGFEALVQLLVHEDHAL